MYISKHHITHLKYIHFNFKNQVIKTFYFFRVHVFSWVVTNAPPWWVIQLKGKSVCVGGQRGQWKVPLSFPVDLKLL